MVALRIYARFRHFWLLSNFLKISGVDLQFDWDEVEAFAKQPDGSLFSWYERFNCYHHLIYKIVSWFS